MPEDKEDIILNSRQAADMLGISVSYLYYFVGKNELHPIPPPQNSILKKPHHKFKKSEIQRFLTLAASVA